MKILLNATPLVIGGAVQTAVATIREAWNDPAGHDWEFAVSQTVFENLSVDARHPRRGLHIFEESPSQSLAARRQLRALETSLSPHAVFSLYGSGYVPFRAPHLLGCVNPWVTHPSSLALSTLSFRTRCTHWLRTNYRAYWIRQADRWWTETETSRQGMHRRLDIPLNQIIALGNTCGRHYLSQSGSRPFPAENQPIRVLCFAAAYAHKGIGLIPEIAAAIKHQLPNRNVEFVITVPESHPLWQKVKARAAKLDVLSQVTNIGVVPVSEGPALYQSCDICLLPTVLETFSATYPEAMAMGVPIVTSDLDFAHDICQDSAVYFKPQNPTDAARAIADLLQSPARWDTLIKRGKSVLAKLPTTRQKYLAYLSLIERMVAGQTFENWQLPTDHFEMKRRAA